MIFIHWGKSNLLGLQAMGFLSLLMYVNAPGPIQHSVQYSIYMSSVGWHDFHTLGKVY